MPTDKERVQTYLDKSVKKKLVIEAQKAGRSVSNFLEQLIKDHLGIDLSEEEIARIAEADSEDD